MMLPVLFAIQLATSPPPECVDPATSLRRLAAGYVSAEQLAAAGSPRMAAAFTAYLQSGSRPDYRTAHLRYEATGTGRYDHAARALLLGLLYVSGPDLNPPGSAGYRHRLIDPDAKAASVALRHLNEAAALDSAGWLAPVALTHIALAGREPEATADAFRALRRALRQPGAPVAVRTALADLLIATDSAAIAGLLLDEHTDGCPGAEAAFAEALLLMGDTVRAVPLLLGALGRARSDPLDRFIEDVAILFGPDERAALARVPEAARAVWIREFWERSAAASARSLAQRLMEHARRTARAHRDFRLQTIRTTSLAVHAARGSPEITLAETGDPAPGAEPLEGVAAEAALPWDARGLVYVRQGAPDTVIQSLGGSGMYLPQTVTWVYARTNPPWLVHFGRSDGPDYFFLGPWIGCGDARSPSLAAPGVPTRVNPRGAAPLPGNVGDRARRAAAASSRTGAVFARDYYLALARVDERYDELARYCTRVLSNLGADPLRIASKVKTLAADYQDVVSGLLATESARRSLSRPLRLQAGAYAFRDAAGTPELLSFAWVPAADVAQLDTDAALELSFALLGPSGGPIRLDTTALVRNGLERDGNVLRATVRWARLPAGEGATRLHVFVADARDPGRGGYAEQRIPTISRAPLAMSSIVVGVPGEQGPLVRGEHRVAPQPGHIVTVGEGFRLFYELYGLPADVEVQTTVRIRRTRGEDLEGLLARYSDKRAERELRFREPATMDRREIVVRDVAIAGEFVPGDYVIDVMVRTSAGELTGSTALRIREP